MRVLAYNVQSCRAGVDAVAEVLRRAGPDVAAVNEVRRRHARLLGRLFGMHVAFGATLRWRRFGNAVLSKKRPVAVGAARLTVASREPRGVVSITLPGGLVVASVHLGLSGDERVAQAGELLAALAGSERVILAGDLNERPEGLALQVIASRFRDAFAEAGPTNGFTFPSSEPRIRIDYVLASAGVRVVSASVVPDVASDHPAVVADLALD